MTLDMEIQDIKRRIALKERKKGEAKGRKERTIELIRNMCAEGLDDALIAKVMKLSEKEVAEYA